MRLDSLEREALEHAIKTVDGKVFLFGSRVDDKAKGGDIDLLVFSEDDPFAVSRTITIRFQMICDEKIDVVVMNPCRLTEEQQAFLDTLSTEPIK